MSGRGGSLVPGVLNGAAGPLMGLDELPGADTVGLSVTPSGQLVLGPTGGNSISKFSFAQATPALSWVIAHNMGTKPSITIVSESNEQMFGRITFPSLNSALIEFNSAVAGTAYCVG